MNRILKTAVLSVAVAATTLATLPAANAGERNWRRHHGHYDSRGNDLAVAGILGLAAGALVVGLASQARLFASLPIANRAYVPRPGAGSPLSRPGTTSRATAISSIEPWTADWYDYCADRYRSFKAAQRHLYRLRRPAAFLRRQLTYDTGQTASRLPGGTHPTEIVA